MKIDEKTVFEFKAELNVLDYINSRPKKEKEKLIEELRLIAVSIIQPRLTYEEILSLELSAFNNMIQQYSEKVGNKLHEKIAKIQQKPAGAMQKGFNFIPISRMNPTEKEKEE